MQPSNSTHPEREKPQGCMCWQRYRAQLSAPEPENKIFHSSASDKRQDSWQTYKAQISLDKSHSQSSRLWSASNREAFTPLCANKVLFKDHSYTITRNVKTRLHLSALSFPNFRADKKHDVLAWNGAGKKISQRIIWAAHSGYFSIFIIPIIIISYAVN